MDDKIRVVSLEGEEIFVTKTIHQRLCRALKREQLHNPKKRPSIERLVSRAVKRYGEPTERSIQQFLTEHSFY